MSSSAKFDARSSRQTKSKDLLSAKCEYATTPVMNCGVPEWCAASGLIKTRFNFADWLALYQGTASAVP